MTQEELESLILEDVKQIQDQLKDPNVVLIALIHYRRQNLASLVCCPQGSRRQKLPPGSVSVNGSLVTVAHPDNAPKEWAALPRGFFPVDVDLPLTLWGYTFCGSKGLGTICSGSNMPDGMGGWFDEEPATTLALTQTVAGRVFGKRAPRRTRDRGRRRAGGRRSTIGKVPHKRRGTPA